MLMESRLVGQCVEHLGCRVVQLLNHLNCKRPLCSDRGHAASTCVSCIQERERQLRALTPAQRLAAEANGVLPPRGTWIKGQFVETDDSPDQSPVRKSTYVLPGSVLAPPRGPSSPLQRSSVPHAGFGGGGSPPDGIPQPVTSTAKSGLKGLKRGSSMKHSSSEADGLYR